MRTFALILAAGLLALLQPEVPSLPQDSSVAPNNLVNTLWYSEAEGAYTLFEVDAEASANARGVQVLLGRIVKVDPKEYENGVPPLDKKNPDKSLRSRSLEGIVYIKGITLKDGKWITPYIYHPRFGIVAKGEILFNEDGTLSVKGRKLGITQTVVMTPVADPKSIGL